MDNNLNTNLETLFSRLDSFVSTKTVVGEPINIGGVIMLPLVDVLFGVAAGASNTPAEKEKNAKDSDAGGLGAKITPSAVIVIKDNSIQLVNVKNQDAVSKLIDMAPGILSKLNLGSIFGSDDKASSNKEERLGKETLKTKTVTETVVTEMEEKPVETEIPNMDGGSLTE